jgi:hypothetical protein
LEFTLQTLSPLGEDVEDELASVNCFNSDELVNIPLLGWRELLIENDDIGLILLDEHGNFLEFPFADKKSSARPLNFTVNLFSNFATTGTNELAKLGAGILKRPVELTPNLNGNGEGFFDCRGRD